MANYKTLGVAEEGECERCGTHCPKKRIAVVPLDADGNPCGDVERWGCNCAALARFGSKAIRHQNTILAEAREAERVRAYFERAWLSRVVRVGEDRRLPGYSVEVPAPRNLDECKNLANRLYNATRARLVGSYFAQRGEAEVVRVDGGNAEQVRFFASLGFVRVSEPVQEAI